jgi:hypothetical protein
LYFEERLKPRSPRGLLDHNTTYFAKLASVEGQLWEAMKALSLPPIAAAISRSEGR